jgi:hypothetical protein
MHARSTIFACMCSITDNTWGWERAIYLCMCMMYVCMMVGWWKEKRKKGREKKIDVDVVRGDDDVFIRMRQSERKSDNKGDENERVTTF